MTTSPTFPAHQLALEVTRTASGTRRKDVPPTLDLQRDCALKVLPQFNCFVRENEPQGSESGTGSAGGASGGESRGRNGGVVCDEVRRLFRWYVLFLSLFLEKELGTGGEGRVKGGGLANEVIGVRMG